MLINQEEQWQKREKYLDEMYKDGKKFTTSQWDAISNELPLRTMHAMSSYAKKGIDIKTIIGDEELISGLVCDFDVQPGTFTTWGKLSPEGLARLLKTLEKKYKVHVQISCMR